MPRPRFPIQPEAFATAPVPDRPLEPSTELPTVAVRAAGNHPFIFRKMVIGPVGGIRPSDGDLVRVVDREHLPLGFGLWNERSQITVRLLTSGIDVPGKTFWEGRLDRAIALRRETLGLDAVSSAYRVIHAEGDGLSGLIVDRFDDVLSVEVFSLGMYQRIGPILDAAAARLGTGHFRVHVDERIALAEDFSGRPVASPKLPPRVTIEEHGVRFRVHFEGGHKTGFFCDQRDNRLALARFCSDRAVLDLCCYTGGFGLYALVKGQAREVTCVDLDEKAIALARENANANQVRPGFVHADAFGYMRQMAQNGRTFGIVVLDPPKLIPNRLEIAPGKRKYFDLNVLAMGLVEPGGLLLTCSCSGLLSAEEFVILLRAAARKAGRSAQVLAVTGAAPDHPVALDALEGAYLKAVWLRMGERVTVPRLDDPEDDEAGNPLA
ncbi:MAG: class I SAM-dependent rRNA methyltransferase [Isosphaeraceae bacterium]|nr:class I SAM-dependent rRNA methyltransferase [Isosphaeraceae bacterium]